MSAPTVPVPRPAPTRSLVEVARALDGAATYRQLSHWITRWPHLLLDHDHAERSRPGSGYHFDLTAGEVDRLHRMAGLVLDGMTPAAAAYLARRGQREDDRAALDVAWAAGRGELA